MDNENNIRETIESIFKEFQPVFNAHKGGAELVAIEPNAVVLRLIGHCDGCALAPLTFGLGIEKLIREKLPQITEVRYTN